jgi:hypothetical protein
VDIGAAERVQRVLLHHWLQALRTKNNGAWDAPYETGLFQS